MEKAQMDIDQVAGVLKLLGDKTRLSMISLLNRDECCGCEFVEIFHMTQPSISQHLRKLKDVGLVRERRSGQWIFYSLNREHTAYSMVQALLDHIPDQNIKLQELEAKGLRIKCC